MAEEALDKQRPINSPLKSRRFLWREPEYPVRWAFLKELREHDKTKKVYDVNPYAEVYQFRDNLYGILTESLDGMGDPWMYLIVGPEKAMLIDTGFGVGDLKGLVREITGDMPLIVVNTHAHFDHAYGNFQFDRVYCHEYEVPRLEAKRNPHIWDYLFDENGQVASGPNSTARTSSPSGSTRSSAAPTAICLTWARIMRLSWSSCPVTPLVMPPIWTKRTASFSRGMTPAMEQSPSPALSPAILTANMRPSARSAMSWSSLSRAGMNSTAFSRGMALLMPARSCWSISSRPAIRLSPTRRTMTARPK